jgi:hypothetical protein
MLSALMNRTVLSTSLFVALLALASGCTPAEPPAMPAAPAPAAKVELGQKELNARAQEISALLDDLHAAAAAADENRYFAHFAPNAVFLGTDVKERWDLAAFRAYAHPHFAAGHGWAYKATRRAVSFNADGTVGYFDEDLTSARIGATRGSGVLVRNGNRYVIVQYNLAFVVPNERVDAMRKAISGDAKPESSMDDLRARHKSAYDAAVDGAGAGNLGAARSGLEALVREAKNHPEDDLEFWLHNELTWVRWAEGDLTAALAHVEEARAAVEHSILPEDKKNKLRLHEKWDRSYLLLELALTGKAENKEKVLAAAKAAKADYDALAAKEKDTDGAAVLAAFFAERQGQGKQAATFGKKVDLEKDSDVQDLYVLARAYEASGDKDMAVKANTKICAAKPYLMKPLIVAQRKREGHGCQ